jgi:DNA-binding CsgD family transcriptional regulator
MAIPFAVLSAVETGQTAEARRHLARAQAAYGERDFLWCRSSCGHAAAVLAWRESEAADTVDALRRAATSILAVGARPFAAFAFLDLAEMAAEGDRVDVAGEAASRLEELASALDHDLYRGFAALGSAWAVLASGVPGRAEGPARAAVEFLAPTGCRAFSARALDALGRSLSGRDRPGAVSALEAAAAGFESCGAAGRRDRTLEMLRQLGTRGRRVADAVTGPASLTRRERQVARLAAQGHSVRQIGERLYISGRTVETHLAAVYAKLGVKSKSELVGRASELEV